MSTMSPSTRRMLTVTWPCLLAILFFPIVTCKHAISITFLQVPPTSLGGAATLGVIRGKVDGAHRNGRIALYAFASGHWWVQPFAHAPYTVLDKDGFFQQQIHLGAQYAALLMNDDAVAQPLLTSLPAIGNGIQAIATVNATRTTPLLPTSPTAEKTLRFSGLDWLIRTIPGDYGAKTNEYRADNVFIDQAGALHMRITREGNAWVCSEIQSVRSLGYGDYRFEVQDLSHLEPAAMFSMFTRVEPSKDGDNREMDIHITQRGDPANKNAEFIVQPYYVPANFYHFNLPPGPTTLELQWSPNLARFSALKGHAPDATPADSWMFTTGVPESNDGQIYINFCNYGYAPIPMQHEAEVVVRNFEFYP